MFSFTKKYETYDAKYYITCCFSSYFIRFDSAKKKISSNQWIDSKFSGNRKRTEYNTHLNIIEKFTVALLLFFFSYFAPFESSIEDEMMLSTSVQHIPWNESYFDCKYFFLCWILISYRISVFFSGCDWNLNCWTSWIAERIEYVYIRNNF